MDNRWSLRKQNTGASLIAVVIALVVVGIIGMLIAQLTITNIHMKEVESSSKKNFYKTEKCMDEIQVKLNEFASECMQDAYISILQKYTEYASAGKDMQEEFEKLYMDTLLAKLKDPTATVVEIPDSPDPYTLISAGKMSYYDVSLIEGAMTSGTMLTDRSPSIDSDASDDALLYIDSNEHTLRLKNIKVKDTTGDYETVITTDIVFSTPKLNFKGRNRVTEYMKYALIADDKISVNVDNVVVDGNVYAGPMGIEAGVGASSAGGTFIGNTIITRGDIASAGGNLTIGKADNSSRVWAENVCTTYGSGNILLQGNSYVADDLTLNSRGSNITLRGEYYGYNYQKKYGATKVDSRDADFSSAMIINAKNSKLDISGLSYLLLAGRTYISSGNTGKDVPMGESISVRANQLAYNVDKTYLNTTDPSNIRFTAEGMIAYTSSIGMSEAVLTSYLKTTEPIVAYSFIDTVSGVQTYYYLNFKDEQSGNDFYAAYVNANKSKASETAEEYLNHTGLQLNPTTVLTLKGDILYRDGTTLKERAVTIAEDDWKVDGTYWDYAKRLAIAYKSLQVSLTETETGITGEDVRFIKVDAGVEKIDKTQDCLFDKIIKTAEVQADFDDRGATLVTDGDRTVVFVDNEGSASIYDVPNGTKGIVVATGDVRVCGTFEGMILSGGTVEFLPNANVKGNSVLVAELFQKDADLGAGAKFIKYFNDYGTLAENVIGTVEVSDYLAFQNWQKN